MDKSSNTTRSRRWTQGESALLVNVDNSTLQRLMNNKDAMAALMSIEGFRNLNQEIETIINKSEAVKKAKKEANDKELSSKEKKELFDEEKSARACENKFRKSSSNSPPVCRFSCT